MTSTRLAILAAATSLVALAAGLAGRPAVLGMAAVVLTVLLCAQAFFNSERPPRAVYAFLAAFATVFCGLLALAFHLHDPDGPLATFGGFPVGTAVLLFGITPVGVTMGVMYGIVFGRDVLPERKLRAFLDRFAGR